MHQFQKLVLISLFVRYLPIDWKAEQTIIQFSGLLIKDLRKYLWSLAKSLHTKLVINLETKKVLAWNLHQQHRLAFKKHFRGGGGGGWSLKSKRKQTGRGLVVKTICNFTQWKNRLTFQTTSRVLSSKLLDSCYKICFFKLTLVYKGVFLLKRCRHFFSFHILLWTCKYLYCHWIYNC